MQDSQVPSRASWLLRSLDAFIPHREPYLDIDNKRRARLVVGISLLSFLLSLAGFLLTALLIGSKVTFSWLEDLVSVAIGLLCLALVFSIRWTRTLRFQSFFLLAMFSLGLFVLSFLEGGALSSMLYASLVVPLLAIFLLSIRWGLFFVAVLLVQLVVLGVSHHLQLVPAAHATVMSPSYRLMYFGLVVLLISAAGFLFERMRLSARAALEESHQQNLRLALSRDAAVEANQAKNEFLANMSHELRTPLNAIIGYAELIEEETEREAYEAVRDDLERIKQAGGHLFHLIDELLYLSELEAGYVELQRVSIDVAAFARGLWGTVAELAKENHNECHLTLEEGLGRCQVDSSRLEQILVHLLRNAAKFTHDGEIELHVSRREGEGQSWIAWEVRDTGIGMEAEHLQRIFGKFDQVDSSSTRRYGGVGIGLAITKELCALMGGQIQVESQPQVGSVFTVVLPTEPSY